MDQKNIAHYKTTLEKEKQRLITEVEKGKTVEDFGSDVDSSDEESDEAEEFGNKLARIQVLKDDLDEIEAALRKIKEGTYGICNNCGNSIEEVVLRAAPESLLCQKCKKQ